MTENKKTEMTDEEVAQLEEDMVAQWKSFPLPMRLGITICSIIFALTTIWVIGYALGIVERAPVWWVFILAYVPISLYGFIAYLEETIYQSVRAATHDSLVELIQELEDGLPTQEDQDRLEALLDEDTKGTA